MAEVEPDVEADEAGPWVPVWRPVAAFVLALVGFGISMYLTLDHFSGVLPACPATGFINCQAVTTSTYSYILHVPVALAGLIFYTATVAINWPPLWRVRAKAVAWARLVMSVGGMGFILYLLSAELFSIKAICLWCTGVHIVTFLIFVLVVTSFPAMVAPAAAWEEWEPDPHEGGELEAEDVETEDAARR